MLFLRRLLEQFEVVDQLDAANRNVFARCHLVAHVVLKDDADFAVKIFEAVLAQVHSIEQDLAFKRIVEPGQQLDDGGLAFAVFADQRHSLARTQMKIQSIQMRRELPG